ncbi:hypothetical protein BDF22DRAFT_773317 [Syncephalis plumigaleata]|nr:hypothetical protein BDF22DRAFT_773317 [Syncephalis plumigaleata]
MTVLLDHLWYSITARLSIIDLLRCLPVCRFMYNIAVVHLYSQPPFDDRFGSPLPRFLAFLNALPRLSSKTRRLITSINLEYIETTLYEEVPETWLYTLAVYCPQLTTLHTGELTSYLNQSAIIYLKPNVLASLRTLELISPVDLSETALSGVAVSKRISARLSGTLRSLTIRKCPRFNDNAMIALLLQSNGISIMFPRLETLELEQLMLTNNALLLLTKSDTYHCLPQLTHLSLRATVNVTAEGILAFIGQRRNSIISATNLAQRPAHELVSLDLRQLPKVSSVLLAHLSMEASYLHSLYVDIDLLCVTSDTTMRQQNNICHSYTWALTQLQLFQHLEHLVIDITNTVESNYNERATIGQYIRRNLIDLKTLTFTEC